jgi:hypothetical protein
MNEIALTLPVGASAKPAPAVRRHRTEIAVPLLLRFLFWATRNNDR